MDGPRPKAAKAAAAKFMSTPASTPTPPPRQSNQPAWLPGFYSLQGEAAASGAVSSGAGDMMLVDSTHETVALQAPETHVDVRLLDGEATIEGTTYVFHNQIVRLHGWAPGKIDVQFAGVTADWVLQLRGEPCAGIFSDDGDWSLHGTQPPASLQVVVRHQDHDRMLGLGWAATFNQRPAVARWLKYEKQGKLQSVKQFLARLTGRLL